ncbi:MAG: hypothetical protein ACO1SV_04570 [Fimbriimonas sp.]
MSTSTPEPAYVLIADAVVAGRQYVRGSLGPAGDFGPAFTRLLSAGLLIAFDPGRGMVEVRPRNTGTNDEFSV